MSLFATRQVAVVAASKLSAALSYSALVGDRERVDRIDARLPALSVVPQGVGVVGTVLSVGIADAFKLEKSRHHHSRHFEAI